MKPQSLLAMILFFSIVTSCVKPGCDPLNMNGPMSPAGSWQLMQDSTSNWLLNTPAVNTNYIGVAGDYFDFRTDGFCYTKEGNVYDTLAYQLVSPKSIILQNFGLVVNGSTEPSVLTQTNNTANITTHNIPTLDGTIFREVNLKR